MLINLINVPILFENINVNNFEIPAKSENRESKIFVDSVVPDIDSVIIYFTVSLEGSTGDEQIWVYDETNTPKAFTASLSDGYIRVAALNHEEVYSGWKICLNAAFDTLDSKIIPDFQVLEKYEITNVEIESIVPSAHEVEMKYTFETNFPYPDELLIEVKNASDKMLLSEVHGVLNGNLRIENLDQGTAYTGWKLTIKTFGADESPGVNDVFADVFINEFSTDDLSTSTFPRFIFMIIVAGLTYFLIFVSILALFKRISYRTIRQ